MPFPLQGDLAELITRLNTVKSDDGSLDALVSDVLQRANSKALAVNRRAQWEYLLRREVFQHARTEGDTLQHSPVMYYRGLRDRLDLVLTFTEHGTYSVILYACDMAFPMTVLQELTEMQTIDSCSHIFAWIEDRSARLTKGMEPQKGKALVMLRTLNELLRRLSKTEQTTFCGRILTFLSGVFPLGERSGVNLRGEYGPQWEPVIIRPKALLGQEDPMDVEPRPSEPKAEDSMDVDKKPAESKESAVSSETDSEGNAKVRTSGDQKKEEFFQTFWSLQLPFSRPSLLTQQSVFADFKHAVNVVLPVISEANKRERLMMGSKAVMGHVTGKRKRTPPTDLNDDARRDYFFSKFLTSPDLLELELADSLFRRQILMQLLVLLQHVQLFTKAEKAKWESPRNRSLQMDFVLEAADEKWTADSWTKAMQELKATTPFGKEFADTVAVILQRERNWISWKNDLCPSFEKPAVPSLDSDTIQARSEKLAPIADWEWKYGSEPLTDLFEMGYKDITDLEDPQRFNDLESYVRQIKQTDKKIEMRKKQIEQIKKRQAASASSAAEKATPAPPIVKVETAQSPSVKPAPTPAPPPTPPRKPLSSTGMHPLPPKPGTAVPESRAATPVKPPPATSTQNVESSEPPKPTKVVRAPPPPKDPQVEMFENTKRKLSWLALRVAREEHWQLFAGAKGNPERMMWMLEHGKDTMKFDDEYSFSVTGWVKGDTSMVPVPPEKRPRTSALASEAKDGPKGSPAPEEQKLLVDARSSPSLQGTDPMIAALPSARTEESIPGSNSHAAGDVQMSEAVDTEK
ncbi:hypothetical protein SISNIDRAFT_485984 [Sistotremastrum niveocremeum HHB9708]|uniref:THO complex subunit 1 transcription elongation factor-domain-containing protein n=1 Tax=Sistotremastrum niveocremeum HHB9708 TaxID=1314777 RepID=A0A164UA35_9AGAM|nr:hypothetical protein SISNIDRAFT_485984 [Sistotremastrum niveocremeum HHB9708]